MESNTIEKVYPTCEELSFICSKVKCPQGNCNAVFRSTSNLNMHLIKHHKISNRGLTKRKTEMQYFCPVQHCPYYKDSKKFFSKLKYLKQHFLKVHALKDFVCKKCDKRFSTESFKTLHMKNCGKLFTCSCGLFYTSSEAVLTHCKRKGKGHVFVEKSEKLKKSIADDVIQNHDKNNGRPERFIYPKLSSDLSFPVHYIAAMALSELSAPCNLSKVVDKGIQTETIDFGLSNKCKSNNGIIKNEKKRNNSQQTQTTSGKCKKLKISTQTQTSSDYLKHKAKGFSRTVLRKRRKSMETQTKDQTRDSDFKFKVKPSKQVNNLFDPVNDVLISENVRIIKGNEKLNFIDKRKDELNMDEDKGKKWLWDNQYSVKKEMMLSSVGKQTEVKNELFNLGTELNLCNKELDLNDYMTKSNSTHYGPEQGSESQMFDINKLCNIETQTEIEAFLTECNEDTTFTLCSSTETQTTNDFDSLLYSNMCTQTCEEVDQLFNFNFVHIETQTAWPDLNDSQ